MRNKSNLLRFVKIVFVVLFMIILINTSAISDNRKDLFLNLQQRLIADGFDKTMINKIYNKPEIYFDVDSVSGYFRHSEARLNYDQFKNNYNINNACKYIKNHYKFLNDTEEKYGVDKEIITAIMLVETRLGTYTGKGRVINIFSTMAALKDKTVRDILWDQIPKKSRISRKKYDSKANSKSGWSYSELKDFIRYTAREKIDPVSIRGSYAGAIGIAQFIPSSIISYAKDGNHDGKIDLFNHEDAIVSIANYVKNFGWKPGISKKKAFKVLYYYNRSKYYVNTLLDVSKILKKRSCKN